MTIAIVGLGLIGGSLARVLVRHGFDVSAWNHRNTPYDEARACGIQCFDTIAELLARKPDILVLCTPLKALNDVLDEVSAHITEATTITDVGSVKGAVLAQIDNHGLRAQYVGAHPMAGNELAGFDASVAELYDGATWVLCVENDTDFARFSAVAEMITHGVRNGFVVSNSDVHDKAAAQISHMPHVVAHALTSQLVDSVNRSMAVALSAGSWRDMTRVALTTPDRTQAMVEENPDNVAQLLYDMARRLEAVAHTIESGNADELSDFFHFSTPYTRIRMAINSVGTLQADDDDDYSDIRHLDIAADGDWGAQLIHASEIGLRMDHYDMVSDVSAHVVMRQFPNFRP